RRDKNSRMSQRTLELPPRGRRFAGARSGLISGIRVTTLDEPSGPRASSTPSVSPGESMETRALARLGSVLHGKWWLDALLGVGGMAAVYAATHRNGTRGAVKILHPEIAVDVHLRKRFLREGYVANKVGHPGVVSVIDDDVTEDGTVYLVMEHLEGETLEA